MSSRKGLDGLEERLSLIESKQEENRVFLTFVRDTVLSFDKVINRLGLTGIEELENKKLILNEITEKINNLEAKLIDLEKRYF